MPHRSPLTAAQRRKLIAELELYENLENQAKQDLDQATLDKHVHMSRASEAGMSLRDIAEVYKISPDTAQRWARIGDAERERRRGGGADT